MKLVNGSDKRAVGASQRCDGLGGFGVTREREKGSTTVNNCGGRLRMRTKGRTATLPPRELSESNAKSGAIPQQ